MIARVMWSGGILLVVAMAACDATPARRSVRRATTQVVSSPVDSGLVQHRADWAPFVKALPTDPKAVAAALETYRQRYGLPFDFFVNPDVPDSMRRALGASDDEMSCGATVTAFVRSIPSRHPLLNTTRVLELDSAGRTLRTWWLGSDVDMSDPIVGVHGNELVVNLSFAPDGVWMRLRPDGTYRISSDPPTPLPPEEWIALAESSWVRVRPNDGVTAHASGSRGVDGGRWAPRGNSGWYVRVDSGPGFGDSAHAIPEPIARQPHLLRCPDTPEFEGTICRGFPGAGRERRIASPVTCS